jgi:protein involved in ribonucleotide reduction
MLIAFASKTGNVSRFANKLAFPTVNIQHQTVIDEPFVLVTYTDRVGQVPENVSQFLADNHQHMVGVAASGNRNWGSNFAKSADTISDRYQVPIVCKFELSGTKNDVKNFVNWVSGL